MTTAELNLVRTNLIGMIYNENNMQVLNEVEKLLSVHRTPIDGAPCCYSSEELKQRVRQATVSIREGKGLTVEEVKSLHPCFV